MKVCVKCGKESDGNFCVYCGGKLEEKNNNIIKEDYTEKNTINMIEKTNFRYLVVSLFLLVLLLISGGYIIYNKSNDNTVELKSKITSLESTISQLRAEKSKLQSKNNDYVDKINFYDTHIVFVIEGYGNYYYTYDQLMQVTQGKEYSYWAYNKSAAIGQGYKAWK